MIVFVILLLVGIVLFFSGSKKSEPFTLTEEFKEILNILEKTNESIFVSGKAGTGKSTLLKYFTSNTNKKYAVLAPTGIAAMNVRGQTIHSFFKFSPKLIAPESIQPDFVRNALFKGLQTLIIDEVSMVNANLMEAIDKSLRANRNQPNIPFGGVQMVFIGDLFQLPPVIKNDVQEYFRSVYGGIYFFDSPTLKTGFKYHKKELTHIFRQKDENFKLILNRIRINDATFEDFVALNSRHRDNIGDNNSSVFLTTTNINVKKINKINLEELRSKEHTYQAILTGKLKEDFDKIKIRLDKREITEVEFEDQIETKFPTNVFLKLKVGAQIMMIKNDSLKRWVNGSVGKISKLELNDIWVNLDGKTHKLEQEKWEEITYQFDPQKQQIKEFIKGRFTQYPLKLAWAITIHKSQGKTFDKIVIDMGGGAFSHGQTYVALSRCTTLEGIVLNREIKSTDIIVDKRVIDYYKSFKEINR